MKNSTPKLQINLVSEFRKMRDFTYCDPHSWIAELAQNAQRAKASEIHVHVLEDRITFEDNGSGCNDPQMIFEKSSTGWTHEIAAQENPFGEGIFSLLGVGDKIAFRSKDWLCEFDVHKALEEGKIDEAITMVSDLDFFDGFQVSIQSLRDSVDLLDTKNATIATLKYLDLRCFLNTERIKHVSLAHYDVPYAIKFDNEFYSGWIAPSKWDFWDSEADRIKLFDHNRFVKDLTYYGLRGVINLKPGALDLRSPERRDFITNKKSVAFEERLEKDIKTVVITLVCKHANDNLEPYDRCASYVEEADYAHFIKFVTLRDTPKEWLPRKINLVEDTPKTVNIEFNLFENVSPSNYREIAGTKALQDLDGYYVKIEDLHTYSDTIRELNYLGIGIVIVRNRFEENAINYLTNLIALTSQEKCMMSSIEVQTEQRIPSNWQDALNKISAFLEIPQNIWVFGEYVVEHSHYLDDLLIKREQKDNFIAFCYQNKIYFNTKYLKQSRTEKEFFTEHLKTISHELVHLLYELGDNTIEFFETQIDLMSKLVGMLDSLEAL